MTSRSSALLWRSLPRSFFPFHVSVPTRAADNSATTFPIATLDATSYHVFMDSAVDEAIRANSPPSSSSLLPLCFVAENEFHFFDRLSFPDVLELGVGVSRIGTSSAVFRVGVFGRNQKQMCALGRYVCVFVERDTEKKVDKMPEELRSVLTKMAVVEPS